MDMKPKERKQILHEIALCSQTGAIGYFDGQRAKAVQDFLRIFALAESSIKAFSKRHYDETVTFLNVYSFLAAVKYDLPKIFAPELEIPYPDIRF